MMRGIHPPHTAELPVTRNMPFPSNSVPSRGQPRNMTGIYLGLEGNIKPPQQRSGMSTSAIPPLARARGYSRIKTPTEHRRYRMVEQLRIKEEKRGFVGQPPKTPKRSANNTSDPVESEQVSPLPKLETNKHSRVKYKVMFTTEKSVVSSQKRQKTVISPELPLSEVSSRPVTSPRALGNIGARNWGPGKHANRSDFYDLIQRNPRNYTVVVNSGVTRSENLTGLMSFAMDPEESQVAWPDVLADEVHRISTKDEQDATALEECYKKVCKGNVESLHSLLPYRKLHNREGSSYSTGFTVRSYRNPNRAQIMAEFTESPPTARPKTVPPNRPLVPSPYFFKYYSNTPYTKYPGSASAKSNRKFYPPSSQFENQFTSLNGTTKVVASPGAGVLTRSLKSRSAGWSENDYKLHTKIHMKNGQTITLYYNKLDTVPGTPGTPTEATNGDQQTDLSDIKEIEVTLPYGGLETYRERLISSRVSTPKLPVQPLNSPTPHYDITVSGRQVQIPMTANSTGEDPSVETGADNHLQNGDTSQGHKGNIDSNQKAEDNTNNNSTQPTIEESQPPEISFEEAPSGGDSEQQGEATTSLDSKALELEKSETMEKEGKGKKDFVLGVADEHGTEGEVEIDSPDQEDAEKAPIRGNVRKASISEKVEKSRVSQAYIDGIKVNAEQRKKDLEKMLDEHAELVQEISRVSSSDNISAEDRDQ